MPFRTFIAVELPGGVRRRAEKAIQQLRAANAKVTWVKPENMHLTFKFLGDVPDSDVPKVCQVVANAVRGFDPFEIVFRGCGAFPTTAAPRTVWIGVDQGAEELTAIHQAIDQALKDELRFPRETRRFQAHLTLGRVRESGPNAAALGALIEEMADYDGDLAIVDEIVTFASFLEKSGPVHNPMGYAPLSGDATPLAFAHDEEDEEEGEEGDEQDSDDDSDDDALLESDDNEQDDDDSLESDDEEDEDEDDEAGDEDGDTRVDLKRRRAAIGKGGKFGKERQSSQRQSGQRQSGQRQSGQGESKAKSGPKFSIPDLDAGQFQKLDLSSLNLKGLHLQGTPLFNASEEAEELNEPIDDQAIVEKLAEDPPLAPSDPKQSKPKPNSPRSRNPKQGKPRRP